MKSLQNSSKSPMHLYLAPPLLLVPLVTLSSAGTLQTLEQPRQPNIILILGDDLSPDHFGCYGDASAKTPFLDSLAKSGVMFQNCWATPMSGPSRAMLITGCYAHRTGVWHNSLIISANAGPLARRHLTFARLLQEAGYATAMAGKSMEIGGRLGSPEVGFDEFCFHEINGKLPDGSQFNGLYESDKTLPGWSGPVTSRYWYPFLISNQKPLPTGPMDFGEDKFVDFLTAFMKRNRNRPFLCYYSMNLPHGIAGGGLPTTPLSGRPGTNTGGSLRECVDYMDVLVRRLVNAVTELELNENTILIFTTDNADAGNGKTRATNRGAWIPMIINGAGVKPLGTSHALVSFADIMPTLADLAGAKLPDSNTIDGQSLVPVLRGECDTHHEWLYSYIGTARMARDANWILEAVDPLGGHPEGRLYKAGVKGKSQQIMPPFSMEAKAAYERLMQQLNTLPHLDTLAPATASALRKYQNDPFPHRLEDVVLQRRNSTVPRWPE